MKFCTHIGDNTVGLSIDCCQISKQQQTYPFFYLKTFEKKTGNRWIDREALLCENLTQRRVMSRGARTGKESLICQ